MNEYILTGTDLSIGYRHTRTMQAVAEGITCGLSGGEMVGLIGPNGIGKSTLLRTLSGLQPPLSGRIELDGKNIAHYSSSERALRLSVVLTERIHAGAMRVSSLVALGRYPHTPWTGFLTDRDKREIDDSLQLTGVYGLKDRSFSELSDGEKQKVLIARAIAQDPKIMILDEPTAFLDLPRRVEILSILKKLTRRKGLSVLLSSHDLDLALKTVDRLWIFSSGELSSGAPEDLVLNGTLERSFSGHGLSFNPADGQFIMYEPHGISVSLIGEGLEALWTQRALEREGYSVLRGMGESPLVRVSKDPSTGKIEWSIEREGGISCCSSILELMRMLGKK